MFSKFLKKNLNCKLSLKHEKMWIFSKFLKKNVLNTGLGVFMIVTLHAACIAHHKFRCL